MKDQLLPEIANRWSPRAFSDEPIAADTLQKILTAGSWAASAFNEQPWRFIVGVKGDDTYNAAFSCLNEWNQKWAQSAPIVILVVGKSTFTYNGSDNGTFKYDCGAAATTMAIQAASEGVLSHQMAGILPEKAKELFNIPDEYEVLTGIVLGKHGGLDRIPEEFHEGEKAERTRKPLNEIAFGNTWGEGKTF